MNLRFINHYHASVCWVRCQSGLMKNCRCFRLASDIYSNVTVLTVSATDVYFTYNNGKGMANAKLKSLSPDLQKHFHYNPVRRRYSGTKTGPGQRRISNRQIIIQQIFMVPLR